MIRPPKRSVTRFFIPLIDVLILLFCIFLMLPFASQERAVGVANGEGLAEAQSLEKLTAQLDRERKYLDQTRAATGKELSGKIAPVLLRIDSKDGRLYRDTVQGPMSIDPEKTPGQVRKMVDEDRKRLNVSGGGKREPYYIFLPGAASPYPTVSQRLRYIRWFAEVDAAADVGRPDLIPGGSVP